MGMNRFPLTSSTSYSQVYRNGEKVYASLELNQVAFPKTGMVVSQLPLGSAFTAANPCENGMWLVCDKSAAALAAPAAATDKLIGIVYTSEKEYDNYHYGLQTFGRKVAGDYPRVGLLAEGDTVTTNCLQYNTNDFANDTALDTALKAIGSTPLYVAICAGSAIPQIITSTDIPASGIYGKIVKYYTMPNGEKGVKYQIVRI